MDERNNLPPSNPSSGVNPGQIREGAGLEESRISQDFVELLRKYSTPFLLLIVIVAGAYFGVSRYREMQARALDAAFLELDQAQRAGSPDGLISVANAHQGQRAVSSLARLSAADIYLASARTRVAVAAPLNPDGTPQNESDLLSDEQRADSLNQAARLYQRVLDDAAATRGTGVNILAINAMFGLASVAEMRGELADAGNWYTRIADRAAAAGLPRLEQVAKERKASLDQLAEPPALYSLAQLPAAPTTGMPSITGADGNPMQLERVEFPPGPIMPGPGIPGVEPEQPVAPQPAPAPAPGEDDGIPLAPGSSGG